MSVQHNLKKVINASGRMSILGVSNLSDQTIEAMRIGGQHYYLMEQVHEEAGKMVAKHLTAEAGYVVNSASAGIALAVAGLITRGSAMKRANLMEDTRDFPREIILMKGHQIDYGAPIETMIQLGGGKVKAVGYANGCTEENIQVGISDATVGIIYVQSHHCVQKNMPSLKEVYALAQAYEIPLLVDAAAEADITAYAEKSDLVIFSGSKAIEGPTSGIVAGKQKLIEYVKAHHNGIGRAMKIGKEAIFGLLEALDNYRPNKISKTTQLERLQVIESLNDMQGVTVSIHQDEAGREIYRARIQVDERQTGIHALALVDCLKNGEIAIYTRDYHANNGFFDIDPRPLSDTDPVVIVQEIKRELTKARE